MCADLRESGGETTCLLAGWKKTTTTNSTVHSVYVWERVALREVRKKKKKKKTQ